MTPTIDRTGSPTSSARRAPPANTASGPDPDRPSERCRPGGIPRDEPSGHDGLAERVRLLAQHGITLDYVTGLRRVEDPQVYQECIENFIGVAQVPVGVIGPVRIHGDHAKGDFYVPFATTEGALIASYNRGAKIITLSGGATALCLADRVSRAPAFQFQSLADAVRFVAWATSQLEAFRAIVRTTTRHGQLEDVRPTVLGNQVYLDLGYTTGDAAGQNTVTVASEAICRYIAAQSPVLPRYWFVEGNLSGDKKATSASLQSVRGKNVSAEVVVLRELLVGTFRTTPEMMLEYWKTAMVAGAWSGSIGAQGQYANALAATFIACGQDVACVSEASVGFTRVDLADTGDLYVSVSLPNLIVGTVGGGTDLPTARECLRMLGCTGDGTSKKFAEICAVAVLAGEISLIAALASGEFTQAHVKYGRRKSPQVRPC